MLMLLLILTKKRNVVSYILSEIRCSSHNLYPGLPCNFETSQIQTTHHPSTITLTDYQIINIPGPYKLYNVTDSGGVENLQMSLEEKKDLLHGMKQSKESFHNKVGSIF
jgi:hypothetical protein